MNRKFIDLTGNRYGKLIVLSRCESPTPDGEILWLCLCDCGKTKTIRGNSLRAGRTRSCGCLMGHPGCPAHNRLPKGESAFNNLYANMKLRAERDDRIWDLTKDQVRMLITLPCHYCGREPSQIWGRGKNVYSTILYNGLDRVDNRLGYDIKNVVACCGSCNYMKGELNQEEFKDLIRDIYHHWVIES